MSIKEFERYTVADSFVEDETALEAVFASLDETFGEEYVISMKYYQLYITAESSLESAEQHFVINISKVKINNIKNAMDTLLQRCKRFISEETYNAMAKMLLYVFSQGKDTIAFLKKVNEQGGCVELCIEPSEKPRFATYGSRFLIPAKTTAMQMYEITGGIEPLIDSGIIIGKKFDFPLLQLKYSFNASKIHALLKEDDVEIADIEGVLEILHFCALKTNKIALLDENDIVLALIDATDGIPEHCAQIEIRIVILRDDCSKKEVSDILERLLTGENKGRISDSLAKKVPPNFVLSQSKCLAERSIPELNREIFDALCGKQASISSFQAWHFAADITETSQNLPGYGDCCPICGLKIETINSYAVKDFSTELISAMDGMEKTFKFSLYMCANDYFAADAWVIDDISVGGLNPFMWLEEVTAANIISPELLKCSIRFTARYTTPDNNVVVDEIFETPQKIIDFLLTPLMAAKWVNDNTAESTATVM